MPEYTASDFVFHFGPQNTFFAEVPGVDRTSTLNISKENQKIIDNADDIEAIIPHGRFPTDPHQEYDCIVQCDKALYQSGKKLFDINVETFWFLDGGQDAGLLITDHKTTLLGPDEVSAHLFSRVQRDRNPPLQLATMGINRTWLVAYQTGGIVSKLRPAYPRLADYLRYGSQGQIVYVSLSLSQPGCFFAAWKDGTVVYNFPEDVEGSTAWKDLDRQLRASEGLKVILGNEPEIETLGITEVSESSEESSRRDSKVKSLRTPKETPLDLDLKMEKEISSISSTMIPKIAPAPLSAPLPAALLTPAPTPVQEPLPSPTLSSKDCWFEDFSKNVVTRVRDMEIQNISHDLVDAI
ncbi:hypothetical protein N7540_002600 [Penicillium herquei]|nr:hypothetical protein N7540_002600 [Penicillium herquei]